MSKSLSQLSSTARDLAIATLKVAATNHYMVGLVAEGVSFDDCVAAHTYLVDLEHADSKRILETPARTHDYELVFSILNDYTFRLHRTRLS